MSRPATRPHSLHFDYPHFDFVRPAELDGATARHAECVFIAAGGRAELIADLRARVARYGRRPEDIKICLAVCLVIGGPRARRARRLVT